MAQKLWRLTGQVIVLSVLTLWISITPAQAYVDPGSGSIIVTTILGFFAAIAFTFRRFFYNIRAKLLGKKSDKQDRSLDD